MLNKNGWGFRSYIICSSILLLALLTATFLIIRLYGGLPNMENSLIDSFDYEQIESNLNNATIRYMDEYYKQEVKSGVITIPSDTLIKKSLIYKSDLRNSDNNDDCTGYSLVKRDDDNILVSASYIKCKYYTSKDYQSWRVENNE